MLLHIYILYIYIYIYCIYILYIYIYTCISNQIYIYNIIYIILYIILYIYTYPIIYIYIHIIYISKHIDIYIYTYYIHRYQSKTPKKWLVLCHFTFLAAPTLRWPAWRMWIGGRTMDTQRGRLQVGIFIFRNSIEMAIFQM